MCNLNKGDKYSEDFIDPTKEDPEKHIKFEGQHIFALDEKGRVTIEMLQLDSEIKNKARKEKLKEVRYIIKIIIWATNYKYTDEIIVNLYRNGIYNFVIAEEQEEQIKILKQLLAKENSYNDIKQKFEATNNIENLEKSYRKTKNNCKIGICGSQQHIGVTLQSIQLAKFLSNLGFNVCYIQSNNSEDIQYLNDNRKKEYFKFNGIDVYCKEIDISDVIIDFGHESVEVI